MNKITHKKSLLLIIGIILVACNLRMPLTSVSPLLAMIRTDIPLTNTMAGFLTTLPLIAFSILSPFVSKISRQIGTELTVFIALLLLIIGSFIRPFGSLLLLLSGTFLIGLAIAVGNVLLPSIIKAEFPFKLGVMTSIYSIAMNLCATAASGLSVPFAPLIGSWQGSLWIWASLTILALLFWLPQLKFNRQEKNTTNSVKSLSQNMWKSPLAWMITIVMGMQSAIFYIAVAWLPEIVQSRGLTETEAGLMLALMQVGIMAATFIVPILTAQMANQKAIVMLTSAFLFIGILGIIFGYGMPIIASAVFLTGIGSGSAFSLSMMFFNLRTKTPQEAAELSGMAQSVGYLLAACGPLLFGIIHDTLHSWNIALLILLLAALLIFICGLQAASNRYVFDNKKS